MTMLLLGSVLTPLTKTLAQEPTPDPFHRFDVLIREYCVECHRPEKLEGDLDLSSLSAPEQIAKHRSQWDKVQARVFAGEMPPKDAKGMKVEDRQWFAEYITRVFRSVACKDGPVPGPYRMRRLNRLQFGNSIRDLLQAHFDAGAALPVDGAGGEGFDNAAETLFLSPVHGEKYLDAANDAFDYVAKNEASRKLLLIAKPSESKSEEDAAKECLAEYASRAYRRPVRDSELRALLGLYRDARSQRQMPWDEAIFDAMRLCLISPHFLFMVEQSAAPPEKVKLNDHELAVRLSYFLWDSMPDRELKKLADQGKLHELSVLEDQVKRMIRDPKHMNMLESFVGQWLGTRDLGRNHKLDPNLFPEMNDEFAEVLRMEPVRLLHHLIRENGSLEELIDANYTFVNDRMVGFYDIPRKGLDLNQNLKKVDLAADHPRGGVLTMASVLAVSSYPNRTSPVLRGKWILEKMLNTPPPPAPPNVPPLSESDEDRTSKTLRERLELHRTHAMCASCHDSLDPLGFGLENYDAIGRYREKENGKVIDCKGQLPSGEAFDGAEGLKKLLLTRKDQVIRTVVTRMYAYAMGRSLVDSDYCEIDRIFDRVKEDGYHGQTMILEIVRGDVFRHRGWKEE